jgi:hypothetical protein
MTTITSRFRSRAMKREVLCSPVIPLLPDRARDSRFPLTVVRVIMSMILSSTLRNAGLVVGLAVGLVPFARPAAAQLSPEEACVARKLSAAGKLGSCVASAFRGGQFNGNNNIGEQIDRCRSRMSLAFERAEDGAADSGSACPSTGDAVAIADFVHDCNVSVLRAVLGAEQLMLDPVTCSSNLDSCVSAVGACSASLGACLSGCPTGPQPVLKTGQTSCYDAAGAAIACAGTGQDGELQKGASRSFTDNADGTTYLWPDAFVVKIAQLNSTMFAGHGDWRVPNLHELETLRDLDGAGPVYQALNASCTAGCASLTCSCTLAGYYLTSTSRSPHYAWNVSFLDGSAGTTTYRAKRSGTHGVRAVRGRI